jgi:threonine dehydratase
MTHYESAIDDIAGRLRGRDAARIVAEPGGSVAFAALTCGTYTPHRDERVGVIICGANTDPAALFGSQAS